MYLIVRTFPQSGDILTHFTSQLYLQTLTTDTIVYRLGLVKARQEFGFRLSKRIRNECVSVCACLLFFFFYKENKNLIKRDTIQNTDTSGWTSPV